MTTEISSLDELQQLIASNDGVVAYFSTPECGVCKVIRPQLEALLEQHYPQMQFLYIDVAGNADVAAQMGVLTVPTVVLFFTGQENQRFVRNFSLGQLEVAIQRPYEMLFGS